MKQKKSIVITGGHAGTTALATIEKLISGASNYDWNISWIGPKRAIEGKKASTLEYKIFPKIGVDFYPIIAGRLQRKWTRWTIPSLLKIPLGFLSAGYFLYKIKPDIILSFGGYAAFPVVFVGFLFGVPVIIHEQTASVGRSNKLSSLFASKIAISREESRKYFPDNKTVLTGNPVIESITKVNLPKVSKIANSILITCGSRGSKIINQSIDKILESLLLKFNVVHSTGEEDFDYFMERKNNLPENLFKRYEVYSFIDPMDLRKFYANSDMVIGRAGANTVSEILVTGRPSILIPIPWSYGDEQTQNALIAQREGLVEIISQDALTPETLDEKINLLFTGWKQILNGAKRKIAETDIKASSSLVNLLEASLK